jgi:KaiC/GvpD/RAD55 family RecA-like ATPase
VRLPNISSSPEQFELAHKKAQDVYRFLRDKGFSDCVIAISGSGWHILIPVNIPCNEETDKIVKDFYTYMGSVFSDDKVEFDEKVFNRSRITKLYSTYAKKGANLPTNPWRQSKIVYIPKELVPTPIEKIKELADLAPKEETQVLPNRQRTLYNNNAPFDLPTWLNEHAIEYKIETQGTSTKYVLRHCPLENTHSSIKEYDCALFVDANGKITFSCFHSHCKNKTWMDFRLFYEPNAYDRPAYQPQPMYQPRMYQPKPKYEIKQELPELGKKWLCMSDIQKVDLSSIPRIKTGINEIDRLLLGLAECEVTLLSGGNASGKSSLLNTLICNFLQQGAPSALFSGELPAHILKAWIQMVAAGKENLKLSQYGDGKYFVPNNIAKRIDDWMDGKFFLFNNEYGNTWEEVFHDMKELLKAGVKVFILDNLMALDIDLLEGDKNNKQKNLILQLKDFAKTNNVHIIIVAHPRKSLAFLRKADISGTADLTNAVDNVFIAHRVNQDFLKAGAEFYGQSQIQRYSCFGNVVEISKNRMYGVCDVLVGLHYELESRRFKNTPDENIHYGWEAEPVQGTMSFNESERVEVYSEQSDAPYAVGDMPFAPPIDSDAPF